MLNRRSLEAVAAATTAAPGGAGRETRPLYDSYCFSRVPWTLEAALTGAPDPRALPDDALGALAGRPQTVVVLFVDAFGWRFFEEFSERTPALARFLRGGSVSKLTALFPSTTAAHVTCLHTGLTAAESGIYEWYQYEPAVDGMIAPLLFSPAGERGRGGLDLAPETLFDGETMHQRLAARAVRSISVTPAEFTPSPFNDTVTRGAEELPWEGLAEGLDTLARVTAERGAGPRLIHYYYGGLDRAAHLHGPDSPAFRAAVRRFFGALERRFFARLEDAGAGARTCVVLTADHGMMAHDPERAVYLDRILPQAAQWLERDGQGRLKTPAGSPRDFFLHLRAERFDEAMAAIRAALAGVAEVRPVDELVSGGYFGGAPPSPRFLARVGNAVILPHPGRAVWWYGEGRFERHHRGDHGGLTPEEMEVPFGVLAL